MTPREKIVHDFAAWTVICAARSGACGHPKSRKEIKVLLDAVDFGPLFCSKRGHILEDEFDKWHEKNVEKLVKGCTGRRLAVGWAAKLLNVYLKTRAYIGREGRQGLVACIHPPLDNRLCLAICEEYRSDPGLDKKDLCTIRGAVPLYRLQTYDDYKGVIDVCRCLARKRGTLLIELDELWGP